jgi:hypothetical protein
MRAFASAVAMAIFLAIGGMFLLDRELQATGG